MKNQISDEARAQTLKPAYQFKDRMILCDAETGEPREWQAASPSNYANSLELFGGDASFRKDCVYNKSDPNDRCDGLVLSELGFYGFDIPADWESQLQSLPVWDKCPVVIASMCGDLAPSIFDPPSESD